MNKFIEVVNIEGLEVIVPVSQIKLIHSLDKASHRLSLIDDKYITINEPILTTREKINKLELF